jgi:hypothetical protein
MLGKISQEKTKNCTQYRATTTNIVLKIDVAHGLPPSRNVGVLCFITLL